MVTSPARHFGAIALLAALAIAVPAAISPAEEGGAPSPATELFGSVEPWETAVEADWVEAQSDAFVEEQRATGASVTRAPCIIGDRPTIEVPELRPYLRRPVGTSGRFVVTRSGNLHFVCHASAPASARLPTEAVVVDDGAPCFLPNRRRTNDSQLSSRRAGRSPSPVI
jgi:hypothetical protein